MTITIGVWVIPFLITLSLFIWPVKAMYFHEGSSWDGLFDGILSIIGFIIGTLTTWLIYFAVMYFCK